MFGKSTMFTDFNLEHVDVPDLIAGAQNVSSSRITLPGRVSSFKAELALTPQLSLMV